MNLGDVLSKPVVLIVIGAGVILAWIIGVQSSSAPEWAKALIGAAIGVTFFGLFCLLWRRSPK
jgi:hypothetical protein